MDRPKVTLRQALFWLNLYRELLEANESALERMHALAGLVVDGREGTQRAGGSGAPSNHWYGPDLELLAGEVERVRGRVDHWLVTVDGLASRG